MVKVCNFLISILVIPASMVSIYAEEVTKVFQNGFEGYAGCEDTHIEVIKGFTGDTSNYQKWHDNFSEEKILNIAN